VDCQTNADTQQFEEILELIKQQSLDYLNDITTRPTTAKFEPEHDIELNQSGLGTLGALREFNEVYEKLAVSSSGPRYWGYVVGGTTPAAIAGDWLATIYDQNPQAIKGHGDISANIEIETIQLLLDLFRLPKDFFGGFVTGATQSNFTCLAVARQWLGKQFGKDFSKEGITGKLNILAATPHSSAVKSLALLGIGSNSLVSIKCMDGNREALSIADLEEKIRVMNNEPFILISSGGTVNTVDFDDFIAIAQLKKKHNFWWHIDAAFGGFAACSDKYKHLLSGWEQADSITIDCHKWLNVPYESAVFFVNEKHRKLQIESFQNGNAAYLGDPLESFSYLNLLPENSRRLKALPAWFTLKAYGKDGYQTIVDRCILLAQDLGTFVDENDLFELLAPVRLNTVCFSLKNSKHTAVFLSKLNETGLVFMTPTVYKGTAGIRAAFVNWRTSQQDVDMVKILMNEIANSIV
jgi:glutamate/tyrosine decarboxylase-like PLP-dependent enzyme